jgi:hypothetical protein
MIVLLETNHCSLCNSKRHLENPNIHNIPYVRSRDQKRWKGHAKKVVSKQETTERLVDKTINIIFYRICTNPLVNTQHEEMESRK